MELTSMGRRLALMSAGCALALGLSAGFAAQQAQAVEAIPDFDGQRADIVSATGTQTNTEGISYDVDGDGAAEALRLAYGTTEEGYVFNASLEIDGAEIVTGLDAIDSQIEEKSLELEAIKLPNGCVLVHVYGYCNESIGWGLDQLYKISAGPAGAKPELAHNAKLVLDCYGKDCLMEGTRVTYASAKLNYVMGNEFVVKGSCMTATAGFINHYVTFRCSAKGKLTVANKPYTAFTVFKPGKTASSYGATLRNVKVYKGTKCKKYDLVKKGTKMAVVGVFPKDGNWLLQVESEPYGKYHTVSVGYIKLTKTKLFDGAQTDVMALKARAASIF